MITTACEGGTHAITVNSLTSVSLDPMLLLVCLDRSSRALAVLDESGVFNVNILGQHQEDVWRTYASKSHDHAVNADCAIGMTGAPLLPGCLAYVHCRIVQRFEAGDHIILLASVEHAELGVEAAPLVFYRGSYSALAPAPSR